MKLCTRSMALSIGILWGGAMLVAGGIAASQGAREGGYYAKDFLLVMASIYPGYSGSPAWGDALIGALYGLVDGAIAGALVAWLYNLFAGGAKQRGAPA